MNKVMLIYPPGKMYQRGEERCQANTEAAAANSMHACNDLGYAAAILLRKGYEVFLKDYQTEKASFEEVKKDILEFRPDMLMLSVVNGTIPDDIAFVKKISCFYQCITVMKGAVFFDPAPEVLSMLDLDGISVLIGGEIDSVIGSLADSLLKDVGKLSDVPGIIYKENRSFVKTDFRYLNRDLDSIPFPERRLMNNALYIRPDTGEPMATVQVARGCPSNCIYCLTPIISGKNVRSRSTENIFLEIEECYYRFGIRNFFFRADTFTLQSEWAKALCRRIIDSPLHGKIAFTVNSRTRPLDAELLALLKEAGCFMIAVGFESGSDDTLERIKKGATTADGLRAAKMIKAAGLPLFGFFMIGFPWESAADIAKTEKLIYEIDPDFIELHVAMPYYGTGLYDECLRLGTLDGDAYGRDYYSPNTNGTVHLSYDELMKIKRKMLLRYYFRPSYLFKKTVSCASHPSLFFRYGKYALKLLKNNLMKGRGVSET